MKKLLCIILLAAMALSLASCAASGSMNSDGVNREIYDGDPSISFSEGSSTKKGITVQSSTVYSREATQDGGSRIEYRQSGPTQETYGSSDIKAASPEFYPQFIEKNLLSRRTNRFPPFPLTSIPRHTRFSANSSITVTNCRISKSITARRFAPRKW